MAVRVPALAKPAVSAQQGSEISFDGDVAFDADDAVGGWGGQVPSTRNRSVIARADAR